METLDILLDNVQIEQLQVIRVTYLLVEFYRILCLLLSTWTLFRCNVFYYCTPFNTLLLSYCVFLVNISSAIPVWLGRS